MFPVKKMGSLLKSTHFIIKLSMLIHLVYSDEHILCVITSGSELAQKHMSSTCVLSLLLYIMDEREAGKRKMREHALEDAESVNPEHLNEFTFSEDPSLEKM